MKKGPLDELPEDLIAAREAAHILGFRQTLPLVNYAKKGYLQVHLVGPSNRKYFKREEILNFPKPLPIPPPPEKFKGHGRPA